MKNLNILLFWIAFIVLLAILTIYVLIYYYREIKFSYYLKELSNQSLSEYEINSVPRFIDIHEEWKKFKKGKMWKNYRIVYEENMEIERIEDNK